MDPHSKLIKSKAERYTKNKAHLKAGFAGTGLGEKKVTNKNEKNYAISEVVHMSAFNLKKKVWEKVGNQSGDCKSGKETNEYKKRNFFTSFGANKAPRFHEIILAVIRF